MINRRAIIGLGLTLPFASASAEAFQPQPEIEAALLAALNGLRQDKGLRLLSDNARYQPAARFHAQDMALMGRVGHVSSRGSDFDSRMRALNNGALVLPSMGENAARVSRASAAFTEIAQVLFQQWLHSSGHRANMMSQDYVSVATGVIRSGGSVYADQIFVGAEVITNMTRAPQTQVPATLY